MRASLNYRTLQATETVFGASVVVITVANCLTFVTVGLLVVAAVGAAAKTINTWVAALVIARLALGGWEQLGGQVCQTSDDPLFYVLVLNIFRGRVEFLEGRLDWILLAVSAWRAVHATRITAAVTWVIEIGVQIGLGGGPSWRSSPSSRSFLANGFLPPPSSSSACARRFDANGSPRAEAQL